MNQIVKVYSGKKGCMCGCRGKWTYTQWGAEHRGPGYEPTISERSVKIIASKVLRNPNKEVDGNTVFVESSDRILAVYYA